MTTADVAPIGTRPDRSADLADRSEFWARSVRGWDVAFFVLLGLTAGAVLLLARGPVLVPLGALAVLAVAYALLGHRAAATGRQALAHAYLAVLFVVVAVVVGQSMAGTLMMFIAYSQIWYFAASKRAGVALTVAMTVVVFGTIAVQEEVSTPTEIGELVTQGGVAVAFAVLLGLWITRVAEQSEERAELLAQLQDAQAELATSHHAAGVMAERERMAREIHDTLAQGFTSVVMLAQTAAGDLRRAAPERAADRLDLIERVARDNLAEARALVAAFSPVALEGSTLAEALDRLARRFAHETGLRVDLVLDDDAVVGLGREREVVLLRAAQEALTNVRRHAAARHVQLRLAASSAADGDAGGVALEVVDDGRGLDPTAADGFGLRGMRERVRSGGGDVAVSSRPGEGTRVRVTLPAGGTPTEED